MRQFFLLLVFAAVFIGVGLFANRFSPRTATPSPPRAPDDAATIQRQLTPIPVTPRPTVPYAVIPGGVQTPDELEHKKQTDPVVGKHYAGIHATQQAKAGKTRRMYASFRVGSAVCFTRRPITIKAGEPILLTDDADVYIRVACGNQLRANLPSSLHWQLSIPDNDRITTTIENAPPVFEASIPPMVDYYIPDTGADTAILTLPSAGGLFFQLPTIPAAAAGSPPWMAIFLAGFSGVPAFYPWIPPVGVGAPPCCAAGIIVGGAAAPEPSSVQIFGIGLLVIIAMLALGFDRNRFP